MITIVVQCFGLIALIFAFLSYFSKNKREYLGKQSIANVAFGVQYLLLGATSGFIVALVSILKTGLFYIEQKKKEKISIYLLLLFEFLYIGIGVLTYTDLISILPCIISLFYTWAAWQPNLKITCIAGIFVGILGVIYNFNVCAYVSIISYVIEGVAGLLGLIKQCNRKEL